MSSPDIKVHPLTNDPTAAWKSISKNQKVFKLNVKIPKKPVDKSNVRFVCMSDTHSLIHNIKYDIPEGDVFVHAGDFTKCGNKEEVMEFNKWIGRKYVLILSNLIFIFNHYCNRNSTA